MNAESLEKLNALLDKDVDIREKIKDQVTELDKKTRTMVGLLNKIHSTPADNLPALLDSIRPVLVSCRDNIANLAVVIPENQVWRWKEMWTNSLRTAVFVAVLIEYMLTRQLLSLPDTAIYLGFKDEWNDRVNLAVEDYLHGLISVVNELSRLSVNAVTLGNFEEPIKISSFVKDIFAGFSMLNLKNDTLRRRYDSLKYDIKKIEEVVYDVSLRKLALAPPAG
ncbi:translin [Crepidotus variabilis]|uniref:Translin n=1 Tax=Crepidotus variabilis TaxID=179855 RepID=A0A9P6ETP4_9AGAR|nr:translin [Crepidotus variabilis]